MSRMFAFAAAAACLATPALAAPGSGPIRLTDPVGGFSYVPPAGWRVGTIPGLKYKIAFAKPVAGFAPNINVVDETATMSLPDYERLNLKQMTLSYPGFHALGQSAFVTNSGLHGMKMREEASPIGRKLRQNTYLFSGRGSRKVVVTASWLASEGNKYEGPVDAAIKTFTLKGLSY